MANYLEILSGCFPDAQAYVKGGDPEVYSDIVWITPQISQAELDASECATSSQTFSGSDVGFSDAFGQVLIEQFSKNSTVGDTWIEHNGLSSNDSPAIIPFDGKLVGVSFCNANDDCEIDLEIYITPSGSSTASKVYTWEFRNGKLGYNNEVTPITFEAGSKLGVFCRKANKKKRPRSVAISVYLQVIDAQPITHIE